MDFSCKITKEMTTDVVIIGGGTAGVFADYRTESHRLSETTHLHLR